MSKTIRTAALALCASLLTISGGVATSATADAKSKKTVIVIGHKHHVRHTGFLYTTGFVGTGCGYTYARWQDTGSFYWKRRYYECRGWW